MAPDDEDLAPAGYDKGPVDDVEIKSGDTVVEIHDGVPYIYIQP